MSEQEGSIFTSLLLSSWLLCVSTSSLSDKWVLPVSDILDVCATMNYDVCATMNYDICATMNYEL